PIAPWRLGANSCRGSGRHTPLGPWPLPAVHARITLRRTRDSLDSHPRRRPIMADRTGTLRGNPLNLGRSGDKTRPKAPDVNTADNSLQTVRLSDAKGKVIIITSVPSLDTPVCDTETRKFNQEAAGLTGVEVWTVSMDLPFAQKRWCGAAGVTAVKTVSDF